MSHKNYRNHGCVETMIRCVGKKDLVDDTDVGRSPIKLFLTTKIHHFRSMINVNTVFASGF